MTTFFIDCFSGKASHGRPGSSAALCLGEAGTRLPSAADSFAWSALPPAMTRKNPFRRSGGMPDDQAMPPKTGKTDP